MGVIFKCKNIKISTKETFRIYWKHLSQQKGLLFLSFAGVAFAHFTILLIPLYWKNFFNIIAGEIEVLNAREELISILLIVGGLMLLMNLFFRTAGRSAISLISKVREDIVNDCFSYLHKHSYSFFTNSFVGSLVKKVNRFERSFDVIINRFQWNFTELFIKVVFSSILLFMVNMWFGLILFTWAIIFLTNAYFFTKYRLKYDIEKAKQDSEVTGVLADTITNTDNVRLFSAHKRENANFKRTTEKRMNARVKAWMMDWYLNVVQGILLIFVELGLMLLAINLWQQGLVTVGDFLLIQAYLTSMIRDVWGFTYVLRDVYESLADAEEMTVILTKKHDIRDVPGASKLVASKGGIHFNKVSFSYNKTRRVLSNFELNIKAGEKVALVGASGSGKSTIIKLLFRFFDVEKGKVFIDGHRIDKSTQDSLHNALSLVPQDPILFHRSLKDNISYGNPKASMEDIIKASKLAHCHQFIQEMPERYNTLVGERGIKLSGGERQRVAIARAILKNSPILVLDEATSSLDSESESLIQDALKKLMKGRTTIVVAHRLSTIMEMDRIIVMDKGKIIEEGSHQALLKKRNGIYKKLWKLQAGGFIG